MIVMDSCCRDGSVFRNSLVHLSGAIRHHTCRQQHWIVLADSRRCPIVAGRFALWVRLAEGVNMVGLACCCTVCRLDTACRLSLSLDHEAGDETLYVQPLLLISTSENRSVAGCIDRSRNTADCVDGTKNTTNTIVRTRSTADCTDGSTADHISVLCNRISLGCCLIQTAITDCLARHFADQQQRQFKLNGNVLICDVDKEILLKLDASDLWRHLSETLYNRLSLSESRVKLWAFTVERDVKLGGGCLALFGSGTLTTWPLSLEELSMCVGDFSSNFSSDYAKSLGGAAHELCHAFGAGHATSGLMGSNYAIIGGYVLPSSVTIHFDPYSLLDTPSTYILYYHRWMMESSLHPSDSRISWDCEAFHIISSHSLAIVLCQSAPPARLTLFHLVPASGTCKVDVAGWLANTCTNGGCENALPELVMVHAQDIYGGVLNFTYNTRLLQEKV